MRLTLLYASLLLALLLPVTDSLFAQPPATRRSDFKETLHGTSVPDPYRWLEEMDSTETKAWVQAQSSYAKGYLASIPGRDKIVQRVSELARVAKANTAVEIGKRLLYTRQEASENQPVLYVTDNGGPARVLINPNLDSAKGISALTFWQSSPDAKWLAYGTAVAGSDWNVIRVRDMDSGQDLPDRVEWTKFASPKWAPDSKSFFYQRLPQPKAEALLSSPNENFKIYQHVLKTEQSTDRLIFESPSNKDWLYSYQALDGSQLLVTIQGSKSQNNLVYVLDTKLPGKPRELVSKFESKFGPVGYRDGLLYALTDSGAPKGRVIAMNPAKPGPADWVEVIPEGTDVLGDAAMHGDLIVVEKLHDAKSVLSIYSARSRKLVKEVQLPGIGSASWGPAEHNFGGLRTTEKSLYYSFSSFTKPVSLFRYDVASGASTELFRPASNLDPSLFDTRQVFYSSKDGTKIPMFLVSRKGLVKDGNAPTLLLGYGGFNVSLLPAYSSTALAWAEMGGIYAVANLRGGSEYGEEWHKAGSRDKKQNVFDDFIAAAEYLIADAYTKPSRLAIMGGSNGGLLVGACLNQRPDLFGAAIPAVGVMDMLRFHKFTIGSAWVSDYGSPDNPKDFEILRKYSPLQNIRKGTQYPPTMVITADHDDRVVPLHSFKYGAAMQYAQEGKAPILIRIETEAGHGEGKPMSKRIEESADMLAFLKQSLKMP